MKKEKKREKTVGETAHIKPLKKRSGIKYVTLFSTVIFLAILQNLVLICMKIIILVNWKCRSTFFDKFVLTVMEQTMIKMCAFSFVLQ